MVRFYAIIMGVTLNCQLSKLVNTFFQYVDQKLLSPKTGKLKKKKPTRIRLKVAPSNGFRHVLLCLGVTLYCIIVWIFSRHSDINSEIKFMKIRGVVTKLNPWHKTKSPLLFIRKNVYGLMREFVERLICYSAAWNNGNKFFSKIMRFDFKWSFFKDYRVLTLLMITI